MSFSWEKEGRIIVTVVLLMRGDKHIIIRSPRDFSFPGSILSYAKKPVAQGNIINFDVHKKYLPKNVVIGLIRSLNIKFAREPITYRA